MAHYVAVNEENAHLLLGLRSLRLDQDSGLGIVVVRITDTLMING